MSQLRPSPFRSWAVLAALAAAPVLSSASSIDDSAARVVVPLVVREKGVDSAVFVTNDETKAVKVQVRYVGERTSAAPGLKICGSLSVPAMAQVPLDVNVLCSLPADPGPGMLVLIEMDPGIARISARARIDTRSPTTGAVLGTFAVTGLPLGAVDTTSNLHVVQGLRWDASVPGNTTDCFFGSLFDGSGFGGMVGRLTLKDDRGLDLGSQLFNLRPFELVALRDVFKLVGAPAAKYEGVHAEIVWTGGGDAVLGYCVASRDGADKGDRTLAFEPALVADPNDEVRKRVFVASGTPALGPFGLGPTLPLNHPLARHGVYVRHPDRLTCGVASSDPNASMVITAVSPDGVQHIGGTSARTPEFGGSPRGSVAGGVADLWGLEVEYKPGTSSFGFVKYSLDCRSGNGTSLADLVF
jgi:hypothetical protein